MFEIDDFDFEEDFDEKEPLKDSSNNNSFFKTNSPSKEHGNARNESFLHTLLEQVEQKENPPAKPRNTNFPHTSVRKSEKVVRPRKFPGPAGLLPERHCNTSLVATEDFLNELENDAKSNQEYEEKEVYSQQSASIFENSETWSALLSDLGSCGKNLLKTLNLSELKVLKKNPRGRKVPFLAVMVVSIDAMLKDPFIHLKDFSGEIHAILHRDVWDSWNVEISPGSVLVLKNVGIIAVGGSVRKYILNITENNITAIYYSRADGEKVQTKFMGRIPTSAESPQILNDWKTTIENLPNPSSPIRPPSKSPGFSPLFNQYNTNKNPIRRTYESPVQKKFRPNHQINHQPTTPTTQQTTPSKPVVQSLFQVSDSDSSIVDSLFDGLDTNELFCDF